MAKIAIKVSSLKKFLSYITCAGGTEEGEKQGNVINEFVISVAGNISHVLAIDKAGKLFVDVAMVTTVIEPGMITIGDVSTFEKYLEVFASKDEIVLSQESGVIKMARESPKKVAKFSTVSIEHIETNETAKMINNMWKFNEDKSVLGTERTQLGNIIAARAEDICSVVKDTKVVGEQHYPFVIMDRGDGNKILKVEVGSLQTSMGVIKSMIPATINSEELNNKYAYGFDNVFSTVKGNVTMYTAPNMPLWVIFSEGDVQARYMITPIVN